MYVCRNVHKECFLNTKLSRIKKQGTFLIKINSIVIKIISPFSKINLFAPSSMHIYVKFHSCVVIIITSI